MLVQTDSRRRITLPASVGIKSGDVVNLEIMDDGRIMLVPIEPVPKHQLWAWTADAKQAISASLADSRSSIEVDTPQQAADVAKRWTDEG